MALTGRTKTAGGYRWAYLNPRDEVSEETSKNLGRANRGKKQSAEQIEKRARISTAIGRYFVWKLTKFLLQ